MPISSIIFLALVVAVVILFIIAIKKKWIGTAGGIYTSQVIMHIHR